MQRTLVAYRSKVLPRMDPTNIPMPPVKPPREPAPVADRKYLFSAIVCAACGVLFALIVAVAALAALLKEVLPT